MWAQKPRDHCCDQCGDWNSKHKQNLSTFKNKFSHRRNHSWAAIKAVQTFVTHDIIRQLWHYIFYDFKKHREVRMTLVNTYIWLTHRWVEWEAVHSLQSATSSCLCLLPVQIYMCLYYKMHKIDHDINFQEICASLNYSLDSFLI